MPGIPLGPRFPDADNRKKPGAPRRHGLGAHLRIALAMVVTPLRMADNHGRRSGIRQHLSRNISGIGAGSFGVAILTSNSDRRSLRLRRKAGNECGRRTNHKVNCGQAARARDNSLQLRDGVFQTIHFPVRGNKGTACHVVSINLRATEAAPATAQKRLAEKIRSRIFNACDKQPLAEHWGDCFHLIAQPFAAFRFPQETLYFGLSGLS